MAGLMDLFNGGGAPSGGLMGVYANPNTAAMLGLGQGLLQASAPSRIPVSMGQALGAGVQGLGQGAANAIATQRQMLQMQALQGLMGAAQGGAPAQAAPASASTPMQPVMGAANAPGISGLSSGMQGLAPTPQDASSSAASAYPAAQPSGPLIMGRTPAQLFQQGLLSTYAGLPGGGDLMRIAVEHDPSLAAMMPTDITKMGMQGGMTPAEIQAANRGGVAHATYIAPVNARPGAILRDPLTMQPMAFNPNIPAGGTPLFDASGNVVGINSIPGAAGVTQQMAAAKTAGEGSQLPFTGAYDAQGNPAPVMSRTQAATGAMPAPLRNNNPGAMMPGGRLAQYPDMQTGIQQMDSNLASYGKQGVNTLAGVISKWAPSNENDTQAYIQDVSQRLGIKPDQPIDLSNPAVRHIVSTGIMLHENGPQAFVGGQQAAGGQIYGAQPMGANTFAQGQVKQMQDRFGQLRDSNAAAQTVRSQLENIMSLAPSAITGAEADRRSYANGLLSLVGIPGANDAKTATDLLDKYSNQIVAKLGQGGLGTDAARAIVSAGNPNKHMTVDAIQEAGRNLSAQYAMTQAKTALLMPFANGNDPASYTKAETTFDKNADPRIWEWQSIQDPAARQKFAAGVLKQDPKFGQKIKALEQLGAFQ